MRWFRYEYLEREDRASLDANQQAAEWSWFYRNAEKWHCQAFRAPPGKSRVRWDSLLRAVPALRFPHVVPLLSVEDLYDEANAMEHCVTYEKYCVVGRADLLDP